MDKNWVDFKAVKEAVLMEIVLAHYGAKVRRVNATYLRGKCPLPSHSSGSGGESFGVQTQKNAWACQSQSCVAARGGRKGGNVLDFVAAMESCSIRDAALKLQEWFLSGGGNGDKEKTAAGPPAREPVAKEKEGIGESDNQGEIEFNEPLAFTLKGVDASHPYLAKRGIKKETAETFGVGFFPGKGSMSGRVVFPIHNAAGELVAYAGRTLEDSDNEYKFPAGFKKSLELFNLHRAIKTDTKRVIVVEGFFDAMKVYQAGFPCVVGLLGRSLSHVQEKLLVDYFDEAVLMLDGNDPGRIAAGECAARLAGQISIKFVWLPQGSEPDQLSSEEIRSFLGSL